MMSGAKCYLAASSKLVGDALPDLKLDMVEHHICAAMHIDMLLSMASLRGIQWVKPGQLSGLSSGNAYFFPSL